IELIDAVRRDEQLSATQILIYGERALGADEQVVLDGAGPPHATKRARDAEQLLREAALVLHLSESELPPELQKVLRDSVRNARPLGGRHVLIVDDDVRNIFALTTVLEQHSMRVTYAENGADALRKLDQETPDLVLMDIMMPEMDGYEATRRIRQRDESAS